MDAIYRIGSRLKARYYYVEIHGRQASLHESNAGTDPYSELHATFMSPLFDLTKITH